MHYLCDHPIVQDKLSMLRDTTTGARQFRSLVRELGVMLTYEATRSLPAVDSQVQTPLAQAPARKIAVRIGLMPVLRAGLSMMDGALELLPDAQVWHLGVYRDERKLMPVEYYNRLPQVPTVDVALILDPMLATGGSAVAVADVLKRWGVADIRFASIIGAPEGLAHFEERHPAIPVYLAALDSHLNQRGYIVPGLGDAGDRQFGTM
jgi:uracil phosphoribosyltransferase